jgi:hypothetical protein
VSIVKTCDKSNIIPVLMNSYEYQELISLLPPGRRFKLMESKACVLSEVRFLYYLLYCLDQKEVPRFRISWIRRNNKLSTLATVLTKPVTIGTYDGEPTSIVLSSFDSRLHGMIEYDRNPLRYMRKDAIYPFDSSINHLDEGGAVRRLSHRLLGRDLDTGSQVFPLLLQLLKLHKLSVGSHFLSNIETFTKGINAPPLQDA